MAIEIDALPREIRDKLEIRESLDSTFFRVLEEDYTSEYFETLQSRKRIDVNHSYIASVHGQQGNGKSMLSIGSCYLLDDNFSIENIYFDYNKLVYDRKNLSSHKAILVDEQAEAYGLDSHRVNIVLGALKEQLRKKSIHFYFCSPTLKPEASSSMYIIETLFIDKSQKLCYAAYKTRDLHCLGYITVPHPEVIGVPKSLLRDYEKIKDEHLDNLTGKTSTDEIADRAKVIMANPIFKHAEKLYCKQRGFIPTNTMMQIINKIYPEFKSNIVVGELAQRIKFEKEMSGEWTMPGVAKKKGTNNDTKKKR